MKLFFLSLFLYLNFPLFSYIPPKEKRIERASFVSTFLKQGDVGAEIGVWKGSFAYHVLLRHNPSKLYLIDPWISGLQPGIEKLKITENQAVQEEYYQNVCKAFSLFNNVEIIRKRSEEIADSFPNEYFDYVYIDGEHSYAGVTRDLNNYFPKIKINGFIIGDDYGWTGVADAVQDFLLIHKSDCLFLFDPYAGKSAGQYVIKRIQ